MAAAVYRFTRKFTHHVKLHLMSGAANDCSAAGCGPQRHKSGADCCSDCCSWHTPTWLAAGVTLRPWLRMLVVHWRDISWATYWHRILFLTVMAALNTLLALPDWWRFNRRIEGQQLHSEPLFILGNPRTGSHV